MDQLTDKSHAGLYAIKNVCEIPDFVKTASVDRSTEGVSSDHFGDPVNRKYPCHTPEDTWLSWAYYSTFGDGNEKTASSIKKYAKFWSIDLPVLSTAAKEASDVVEISYTFEDQVHSVVKVASIQDLDKVATDLRVNASRYPYDMRMGVAKQVLGAAKRFNGSLAFNTTQDLQKMAGYGVGSLTDAMDVITRRMNSCHRYGIIEQVNDIKADLAKQAHDNILPPHSLVKVARFADAVDRLSKEHKLYGSDLSRPEEALFSVTLQDMDEIEKRAAVLADGTPITAKQIRKPEVRKMVSSFLGQKVAYDELFDLVQTLPRTQCQLLARVIG